MTESPPKPESPAAESFRRTPESSVFPPTRPPADVEATRWIAVGALIALIALSLAWELWLAPLRAGGSFIAFVKAVPLCIPLLGLLRRRMYTYRWVSLFVWLYFTDGVVRAWKADNATLGLALAEVALCLLLFGACAWHVRTRLRNRTA